ncbi:FHA domain containing protein, putative [Babesia bigemina]|uniref:FHA domain containing protein, putative n=1 Tax=Babesia bigemina TaxID=5866 RepID=A0A061D6J7_BABBI|nr:FHA domain containing protein, putative [Babesia bigemina]CDR95642.1 FHA domain containing protein, putative [Babesia bigemina]|eukprot:XP_012767828.1 FHA domain containing protein, putative [Babesia bigemina]
MLRVCTRTWTRDSHDLFDYETQDPKQLAERHFAASNSFRLLRTESTVSPVTALSQTDATNGERERDHLLSVFCRRPGEYTLAPAERVPGQSLIPQRLWLVVRALPNKRYALQEHDVIKLGRYRLRVKKIVPKNALAGFDVSTLLDFPVPELELPVPDGSMMQCRICLSESTDDDKLLCPCECKGSIKYVHAECMRRWIHLRAMKDSKESDQPLKAALLCESTCELCKARLPPFVRVKGELIPLVMMPNMSCPFILLENVTPHANKGMHFISVQDSDFVRLGRGHDASVRIADVSISRNHATILYENDTFYLEDHDSKFGTLVALRRPTPITASETVAVQVGRSLIELTVDPTIKFAAGCVDIPPVLGSFNFCNMMSLPVVMSESATPVVSMMETTPVGSTPQNTDESMGTTGDVYSQEFMMHFGGSSPMSREGGESVHTLSSGRRSSPVFLPETNQEMPSEEASTLQSSFDLDSLFGRQQWDSMYGEDTNSHMMYGSHVEEPCPGSTNDGIAYLRLILNTPSRNHILRNLRYHNRTNPQNRIIQQTEAPCFPSQNQGVGFPVTQMEEPSANACFLPDNAFMNLDGAREASGSDTSTSALDGNHSNSSQVTENVHNVAQWMPLGPGSGAQMHQPK